MGKIYSTVSGLPLSILINEIILIVEIGLFRSASDPDNDPTVVWLSG